MDPEKNELGVIRPNKLGEILDEEKKDALDTPIKPLKTYQSDVAEAIKRDNISVIKMALAEKKRQEKSEVMAQESSKETKKSLVYVGISLVLILAGLGALGIFYYLTHQSPVTVPINIQRQFIFAESTKEVSLDNLDLKTFLNIFKDIKSQSRNNASIASLSLIATQQIGSSTVGVKAPVSTPDFINFLDTSIPAAFYRSLSPQFMLGIYQNDQTADTFLILRTDSYENAFAGMLLWEKNMPYELDGLFGISDRLNQSAILAATSSTSASSTFASPIAISFKPFADKIINNRDTRVITDVNGKVIFLYSFIDPDTIVLTTSENAFKEILSRYIENGYQK